MIKTVEVENEKVKVIYTHDIYMYMMTYTPSCDVFENYVYKFFRILFFLSCKFGILPVRRDFAPSPKVTIDQPTR